MTGLHSNEEKAKAIGVELDVYNGLLEVRRRLLSGELQHSKHPWDPTPGKSFSMETWEHRHPCGTVYCIGGLLEVILHRIISKDLNENPRLEDLFYPFVVGAVWKNITPKKAAEAIDNFLTRGVASWREVMGLEGDDE